MDYRFLWVGGVVFFAGVWCWRRYGGASAARVDVGMVRLGFLGVAGKAVVYPDAPCDAVPCVSGDSSAVGMVVFATYHGALTQAVSGLFA